jgi:two-component system cell cycle response regulator DivK
MSTKILLVEDNEQNRYLATFILERVGYEVIHAPDGAAAIAAALTMDLDLVLLDVQLPGMDGHEVARALRQIPGFSETPIIAVTSYAMVGDREKALAAGCNGYLEKPINPETFAAEVASFRRAAKP